MNEPEITTELDEQYDGNVTNGNIAPQNHSLHIAIKKFGFSKFGFP